MRRFSPVLLAALTLGACGPLGLWHKTGVSVARMQNDTLACRTQAAQKVPVSTQIRRTAPRRVPRRICDQAGNCNTYYDVIPGDFYTYDANEGLRAQVANQCMITKGYSRASVPPCPASVAQSTAPARTTVMPALGPQSCAIRNQDGSFQILTPG